VQASFRALQGCCRAVLVVRQRARDRCCLQGVMSAFAMPMVIINMGGEMIYILAQRLSAQNVPADKSKRVLQDVVRTMYNPIFIQELFRPQDVYTMQSTRQIFDRLAHSSIMRLNESSMDKLYDLMTMGFKYQILASSFPQELLHVTLNHLYQLRTKVEDAPAVTAMVDDVINMTNERYATMSALEFAGLKQVLCRFFSDKRVKVSLFLQDGLQKNDGNIALGCAGHIPPGVDAPGQIMRYDPSGAPLGIDSFVYPDAHTISDTPLGPPIDPARGSACQLGLNLYSKEAPVAPPPDVAQAAAAAAAAAAANATAAGSQSLSQEQVGSVAAERAILSSDAASNASRDLNLLADLIGPAPAAGAFKLNLFPETAMPGSSGSGGGGGGGGGGGTASVPTIIIDAGDGNEGLAGIMDEMRLEEGVQGEDDDLLNLMDAAGK